MDAKNLYYEVTEVETAPQIKEAYDYAIKKNIKYYRCVSKSGKFYYYDGKTYKLLPSGQEWAENPYYDESNIDYKSLYERTLILLHRAQDEAANNLKKYIQVKTVCENIAKETAAPQENA